MSILNKAKAHFQQNLPFILFSKPYENQLNAYFQRDNKLYEFENQSGFVFVSFDGLVQVVLPKEESDFFEEELDLNFDFKSESIHIPTSIDHKTHFENLVDDSVQAIKSGKFEKLVVSRKIDFSTEINVFHTYQNLLKTYPTAFRYLFFHPKVGLWMGATPEQLIKINENQFETVALAGTQLFTDKIHWSKKEIQEQQFVTNYIVSNCKQYFSNVKISEPITVQAGKLAHIKTIISGSITKDKELELISTLHPTPAVCGLPKEEAKIFILNNEGYNRKFYAGFLGEWNINETTNLFVNLRCMEVGVTNSIYVGCGITKDSIAENEFIETQNKSETIKNIIITK